MAAADFVGAVSKTENEITLKVVKNKNGPTPQPLHWHLDTGGVVCKGGSFARVMSLEGREAWARATVAAVREVGSDRPVSRSSLGGVLAVNDPGLFGETQVRNTVVGRITKGSQRRNGAIGWWLLVKAARKSSRSGLRLPTRLHPRSHEFLK